MTMDYALWCCSQKPCEGDCRKPECRDRLEFNMRTVTWDHGSPWSSRDLGILSCTHGRFQHQIHGLGLGGGGCMGGVAGDYTVCQGGEQVNES